MPARPRRGWATVAALVACIAGLLALAPSAMAATFNVTTASDSLPNAADNGVGDGFCISNLGGNPCTLRAAIQEANFAASADLITFAATPFDGTAANGNILIGGPLPQITQPVEIRGCASPSTDPCVGIDGQGGGVPGLDVNASSVKITGISIVRFSNGQGILLRSGNTGLTAQGNWLGMDLDEEATGNGVGQGVRLEGGSSTVGGTTATERNVFASNTTGVKILTGDTNTVSGNYFGTDKSGAVTGNSPNSENIDVASSLDGLNKALNNVIGGTISGAALASASCDGACNLIVASSAAHGIDLDGSIGTDSPAGQTTISGNFIGVSVAGTADAGNAQNGINAGAAPVTIGGPAASNADRNYIGGNSSNGIVATGGGTVQNNFIGLSSAGTAAIPDGGGAGADLTGSAAAPFTVTGNRFGGESDSPDFGLRLRGDGSSTTASATVTGNTFGVGTGGEVLPFEQASIRIDGSFATIGGTGAGQGNVVGNTDDISSGESEAGIWIDGENPNTGSNNRILGNFIGTDSAGTADLGNEGAGILISNGDDNVIGDPTDALAGQNVISNNSGDGIELRGNPEAISGNLITRNRGSANGSTSQDIFIDLFPGTEGPGNGSSNGHDGIEAPSVTAASTDILAGLARPGATVRVFRAPTGDDNELGDFLGKVTADGGTGDWKLTYSSPISVGDFVTATQADTEDNSSELSPPVAAEEHAPFEVDTSLDTSGSANDSNTADGFCNSNINGNPCTLRAAMQQANATTGANTISFDTAEMLTNTITPGIDLPDITEQVTIDGCLPANPAPIGLACLEIAGSGSSTGLLVEANTVTLRGLALTGWSSGIELDGDNTGLTVKNSQFGIALNGGVGANTTGVLLRGSSSQIGGTAAGDRNVFGNGSFGLKVFGGDSNTVLGNYFGVTPDGAGSAGHGNDGISVSGDGVNEATGNTIGGTVGGAALTSTSCDGACNLLVDANNSGINLSDGGATGTTIAGNFVGISLNGNVDRGNAQYGIVADNSATTTIGGPAAGDRNYIGGNSIGVSAVGTATGADIRNNFIGLNSAGTAAIPDSIRGVDLGGSGTAPTARFRDNRLGGDGQNPVVGLQVLGDGTLVTGNTFGLSTDATPNPLPIRDASILVQGSGNTIGGTGAGDANVVTETDDILNTAESPGIRIDGSGPLTKGDNNIVRGNLIGLDASGAAHGNEGAGIEIVNNAEDNVIGGTTGPASTNIISNNGTDAIRIGFGPEGNLVQRNTGSNTSGANNLFVDLGPDGPGNGSGTHGNIARPEITSATSEAVSGETDTQTGTVDVYRTAAADGADPNDLIAYVGTATVTAGTWTLNLSGSPLAPQTGQVTAIHTESSDGSTEPAVSKAYTDATPPETTITSGPADSSSSTSTSATFTFTSEAGATFQCSVEGGAFGACSGTGTHTVSGLSVGPHSFAVRATDTATNTDPTPATRNFTVLAPPVQPAATENPECAELRAKLKKLNKKIKKADDPDEKAKLKKKRKNVRKRLAALGCAT